MNTLAAELHFHSQHFAGFDVKTLREVNDGSRAVDLDLSIHGLAIELNGDIHRLGLRGRCRGLTA